MVMMKRLAAILLTAAMVVTFIPVFGTQTAKAAESSTVRIATQIKDSSTPFGGGKVMISGTPIYGTHDQFVANATTTEFSVGSEVTIKAKPEEGYHFVEWQRGNSDNYGGLGFSATSYSTNAEQTFSTMDSKYYLYAIFEKDPGVPCRVIFNTRGGGTIEPQDVASGEKAVKPDDPTLEGPGWGNFEGWYSDEALTTPFNFNTPITSDITLYAKWYYGLSVGTYNMTSDEGDYKCGYFNANNAGNDYMGYSGNCNFTMIEGPTVLEAYPNNGYRFKGWYEGEYVGGSDQSMKPKEPLTLLSDKREYSFSLGAYTCLIPVFEKAPQVNFVDIGNVWTKLDPVNEVPFTGEVNPNEEGLGDFIELADERWEADGSTLSKSAPGVPAVGKTYKYTAVISAKGDNTFDPASGFRFVYGGDEYDIGDLQVTYSTDCKSVEISGFVPEQKVEKVNISKATVTGIAAKTYTGSALTQNPVVKMTVNGTPVTLRKGTDYSVSYDKNTNAGTAKVIIKGAGNYDGQITKTFTIKKAANPMTTKAKTATVKYKKLKKKNQALKVSKVIAFPKNINDGKTYKYVKAVRVGKKGTPSSKAKKHFKVAAKTGKVKVIKGLKKGTYKVTVKVRANGNANYAASKWTTVKFKVKVR